MVRSVPRRRFLQGLALAALAAPLAAACAPAPAPTPTPAPAPTPTPAAPTPTPAAKPAQPTPTPAAQPTPTARPAAALQGARLHLLWWTSFVPEEDKWFKETLVATWARPNGVELTVELVSGNEVQPKVVAALQAGAGPDITILQWTWPHLYAEKLHDVSDIAEKIGNEGGGWYEALKQNSFVQGKWRAVPFGILGNAIVYRESWMREGSGAERFPTDWDEYTKVGEAVKKKKGVFVGQALGHSFGDPPTFVYPFLWSYGGAETDPERTRVTINSPETEAALVAFKKWFDAVADPQCLSWDDSSNNRAYLASQIWATLNGASIYVAAQKQAPDIAKDSNHALLPKGPKGQFMLALPFAAGIPSYVKNPEPARQFLTYLMSPATFADFMKQGKGYTQAPYRKGETPEMWPTTDPKMEPYKQVGNLSKWYGYPAPPSPAATEVGSKYIIVDMFAKVVQGENPKAVMQWAEGELKRIHKL